jgi:hypothetical protein
MCAKSLKNFDRGTRKILIHVKPWFSTAAHVIINLPLFPFDWRVIRDDTLNICPRHKNWILLSPREKLDREGISRFFEIALVLVCLDHGGRLSRHAKPTLNPENRINDGCKRNRWEQHGLNDEADARY